VFLREKRREVIAAEVSCRHLPAKKPQTYAHPAVPSIIFLADTGNLPIQRP